MPEKKAQAHSVNGSSESGPVGPVTTTHHITSCPVTHTLTPGVDEVGRDYEKDEAMLYPVSDNLSWELEREGSSEEEWCV